MPYTRGPHALPVTLPVMPRPELHSSRKIDAQTKRYAIDQTTGGNESMQSTAQRVLMLVSFADVPKRYISDSDLSAARDAIIAALEPLTGSKPPAIDSLVVEVGSESAGTTYRRITYRDLTTGQDETVQA